MRHVASQRSQAALPPKGEEEETSEEEEETSEVLPWMSHDTLVRMPIPRTRWLVDGLWTWGAQGLIAGEPKTSKSFLALALGLAVASGRPFLGKYRVGRGWGSEEQGGAVLMVDCETGQATTQERLRALEVAMGIVTASVGAISEGKVMIQFPEEVSLPIDFLHDYAFDLTDNDMMDRLVEKCKETSPALLILDPLYLMLGQVDENHVSELRPVLRKLGMIQKEFGCAIAIVHHMKKTTEITRGIRPGQRVSGSWAFHGWSASSLYCTQKKYDRGGFTRVFIEPEHRSSSRRATTDFAWSMSEDGETSLSWEIIDPTEDEKKEVDLIESLVIDAGGTITRRELERLSGLGRKALDRRISAIETLETKVDMTRRGQPIMIYHASQNGGNLQQNSRNR
jgi:hypothetical protein